jgi:hypothetical protein
MGPPDMPNPAEAFGCNNLYYLIGLYVFVLNSRILRLNITRPLRAGDQLANLTRVKVGDEVKERGAGCQPEGKEEMKNGSRESRERRKHPGARSGS